MDHPETVTIDSESGIKNAVASFSEVRVIPFPCH